MGQGFSGGPDGKESACNAGDPGYVPRLGRSLEKGTATHSSILAWRIPWTEETGRLRSMGLQSQTQLSDFHFHSVGHLVIPQSQLFQKEQCFSLNIPWQVLRPSGASPRWEGAASQTAGGIVL